MALELLTLALPPELEDEVVDVLLAEQDRLGFTSLAASGLGSQAALSVGEQVRGRQRRSLFQIVAEAERIAGLLEHLKQEFAGTDIRYWTVPVSASGRL